MAKGNQDSWRILEFMDEVSEDMAMKAVKASGKNLKYISNPSTNVVDAAIKQAPTSIMYAPEPTNDQIVRACSKAPRMFTRYADLLSDDEIIEIAATCVSTWVMVGSSAFNRVAPMKAKVIAQVRHEIIGKDDLVKQYIKKPTPELAERMVSKHHQTLLIVDNPTDSMYEKVLTKHPKTILHIKNPPLVAIKIACMHSTKLVPHYIEHLDGEYLTALVNKVITRKSIHCANKLVSNDLFVKKADPSILKMLKAYISYHSRLQSPIKEMDEETLETMVLTNPQALQAHDVYLLNDDLIPALLVSRPDLAVRIDNLVTRFPWFIDYAPQYVAMDTNDLREFALAYVKFNQKRNVQYHNSVYSAVRSCNREIERNLWGLIRGENCNPYFDYVSELFSYARNEFDLIILHNLVKKVMNSKSDRLTAQKARKNLDKLDDLFIDHMT